MQQRLATLVLLVALVGLLVLLVEPRLRHHLPAPSAGRASWTMTPGVVNAQVTPRSIRWTICRHGWTRTIRPPTSYTNRLKLEQMRAYGRIGAPWDYQEDHLISLEIGGHPTDPRNLWPEPRPRAEEVDRIENDLREDVCSGRRSLAEAQERISSIKHSEG